MSDRYDIYNYSPDRSGTSMRDICRRGRKWCVIMDKTSYYRTKSKYKYNVCNSTERRHNGFIHNIMIVIMSNDLKYHRVTGRMTATRNENKRQLNNSRTGVGYYIQKLSHIYFPLWYFNMKVDVLNTPI